jgi:formamidopyrimidine-DNA glycosylase
MPELPDLNVFSSNLDSALRNRKVKTMAKVLAKNLNVSPSVLKEVVEGQTVKSVYRDGKELHIGLKSGDVVGLHLMLHGGLTLSKPEVTEKYPILELVFDNGIKLTLSDWQRAANVKLNPEEKEAPDALSEKVTLRFLKELLQSRGTIKNVLLDQDKIRGIGNAYADEILWEARISPFSVCNMIPEASIRALHKAIKKVLVRAEKQIRKTHPDIISGEVRDFLSIHNAKKTESPTGHKIANKKAGGRPTYFTDEQELYD